MNLNSRAGIVNQNLEHKMPDIQDGKMQNFPKVEHDTRTFIDNERTSTSRIFSCTCQTRSVAAASAKKCEVGVRRATSSAGRKPRMRCSEDAGSAVRRWEEVEVEEENLRSTQRLHKIKIM